MTSIDPKSLHTRTIGFLQSTTAQNTKVPSSFKFWCWMYYFHNVFRTMLTLNDLPYTPISQGFLSSTIRQIHIPCIKFSHHVLFMFTSGITYIRMHTHIPIPLQLHWFLRPAARNRNTTRTNLMQTAGFIIRLFYYVN